MMARSYDFGECRGGKFQMTRVALVIAVGELGRDLELSPTLGDGRGQAAAA